jgi:hypothetical protein
MSAAALFLSPVGRSFRRGAEKAENALNVISNPARWIEPLITDKQSLSWLLLL